MDADTGIRSAEDILSDYAGRPVVLQGAPVVSTTKHVIVRCRVLTPAMALPASVIVKHTRTDGAHTRYDPDWAGTPNAAHGLLAEWAALAFLATVAGDPPLAPRFYGGNRETGTLVMEDYGTGITTTDAVLGDDPERATEFLVAHGKMLGQLHAHTIGLAQAYRAVRAALGPQPVPPALFHDPWAAARGAAIPSRDVQAAWHAYGQVLAALGLRAAPALEQDVALVAQETDGDPGSWLAYCQGDQNLPGGAMQVGQQVRLFDFDAGGFRHALLEGVPGRLAWGCMLRLPDEVVRRMEHAYRHQLSLVCPAARDDRQFYRAMVIAAGRWQLFQVLRRLPEALVGDRQRGPSTLRQQVVAWLRAFGELSAEYGHLEALGQSARALDHAVCKRWPEATHGLPYYPAFRA